MKNIFRISIIAIGLLFTNSCNDDLLDTYAPGVIYEEEALLTTSDLQLLLNTTYNIMTDRGESEFVSIFTDEVGIGFANGGQGLSDEYVFQMTPGSALPSTIWGVNYLGIANANRILEAAENITPVDANDQAAMNRIRAQALTLRAYGHLTVLSYFTQDMTDNSALAGLIADRVYDLDENDFPRRSNGDMYAFIHQDLDDAIALFQVSPIPPNPNIATINFAKGLKARAYLYKEDYVNAELWANDVITNSGISLANKSQYLGIFITDAAAGPIEVIFRFQRTNNQNSQGSNLHNAWFSVRPERSGSPFFELSRALHNKLNPGNFVGPSFISIPDIRAGLIIGPDSKVDPNYSTSSNYIETDQLIINKHGGRINLSSRSWARTATNANNNSIKIMRISEMHMIVAEARANANDFMGVQTALQNIRTARGATALPVATSSTEAWKQILDERRLEFAFEGFRFLDIKRLGVKANSGIDRDPADYSSASSNYPGANPSNLPLSSYKWTLPIPNIEVNVNTEIVQNPGY